MELINYESIINEIEGFTVDGYEEWKRIREREEYDSLKKRLTSYVDKDFWRSADIRNNFAGSKEIYSFTLDVKSHVWDSDDLSSVLKVMESYLDDCRGDVRYGGWDFELNPDTLRIECYNADRKKEMDEEEEKRKANRMREKHRCQKVVNEYIDKYKKKEYPGVISAHEIGEILKGFSYVDPEYFLDKYVVPFRDDFKKVNPKQYKIIYGNGVVFEIKGNKPFYEDSADFDGKKLKLFLNESMKVYVGEDVFFVPFGFKKDSHFNVLVVNNLLENIEQYRLPSLNYLNKQHNLYYVIETNISESFKGNLNDFKSYVLKECQKIVKHNTNKLYGSYTKISHFKDDKVISKQYKTKH